MSENQNEQLAERPKFEVVEAIEQITRGEIDVQIATAHKFPRSMKKFLDRAVEMATLDEETAASCLYSRPVGQGKFAEGMSVRMAEIVGACYGNLRVGAMLIDQTDRWVKARGMAHDLESNFASTSEVLESTVDKNGNPFSERMRIVVAKAALAKARRDATFIVVPRALCKPVETKARAAAIGDATTMAKRRAQVMEWIGKLGIDARRIFAAMGVEGEADIGLDELATLTGIKTAIKDGDVSVDEAFPVVIEVKKSGLLGKAKTDISNPDLNPAPKPGYSTLPSPGNEKGAPAAKPAETPPADGTEAATVEPLKRRGRPPAAVKPAETAPASGPAKAPTLLENLQLLCKDSGISIADAIEAAAGMEVIKGTKDSSLLTEAEKQAMLTHWLGFVGEAQKIKAEMEAAVAQTPVEE